VCTEHQVQLLIIKIGKTKNLSHQRHQDSHRGQTAPEIYNGF